VNADLEVRANRFLTATENLFLGYKLAEYHTGYRAFSAAAAGDAAAGGEQRRLRLRQPDAGAGDLVRVPHRGDLVPGPDFPEASSINFRRSVKYGLGVLGTALEYRRARNGAAAVQRFADTGRKLPSSPAALPAGKAGLNPPCLGVRAG